MKKEALEHDNYVKVFMFLVQAPAVLHRNNFFLFLFISP